MTGKEYSIPDDAFIETDNGTIFIIEVSASSKREKFPDNYNPWRKAIGVAVLSPPVEGKANRAIITLISKTLNISQSNVTIISGHTSSVKKIKISCLKPDEVKERCLLGK